jgi:protein SCO1/2
MSASSRLLPWLIVIAAAAAGLGLWAGQRLTAGPGAGRPALSATLLYPQPRELQPFELRRTDGTVFDQAALRGHWTLMFFGFTNCPDVCPTTLASLRAIGKVLAGDQAAPAVGMVFVSVDPERDTPKVLHDYVAYFSRDIVAVTADIPKLEALSKDLGVVFAKSPLDGGGYTMDHSAQILLLDPQGRLAGIMRPPHDPAAIVADLKRLAPPA